jgi:small glutamine-rich tetratricopeptide repeat-containing protein alpha
LEDQPSTDEVKSLDDHPLQHVDLYKLFINTCLNVSPEKKAEAEALKNEGNHLMKLEKYHEALTYYNRAINMDATNPVFYCNRAAAYSKIGELLKAIDDCKMSLRYDSNYSKAYGRLGLAYSKLNRHQEAIDAYLKAIAIEPDNIDYKNNLAVTQERLNEVNMQGNTQSGLPGINLGAVGAALGAGDLMSGGNPDFSALFNNPAFIDLATRMIGDPVIQNTIRTLGQSGILNEMGSINESSLQQAAHLFRENPEFVTRLRQQYDQASTTTNQNPPRPNENNPPTNDNNKSNQDDK